MGDSYVELIAAGSDESMLIVQSLLEVASHPAYDISSMTYNFWQNLQVNLTRRDSYLSYGFEASIEAERNWRLQVFGSPFEMLALLVSFRVEYPPDYQDLSEEDHRDFKHARHVGDVLIDATAVLGGEPTLKILFMKLAQIMTLLPKLPPQPQLMLTVYSTIGAYSKWIDASPVELSILPPVVDVLTRGISASEDSAAAVALAFKYICEDCSKKFFGSLDDLFHIYHIAISGEGGYKLSSDDSMHLVEALRTLTRTCQKSSGVTLSISL